MDRAVKALIYNKKNYVLLQLRDKNKNIQFKNTWSFFGGKVEQGECLISALKRELIEEVGVLPGKIGKKKFLSGFGVEKSQHGIIYIQLCTRKT